MTHLSTQDATLLRMDSPRAPQHIGVLLVFRCPPGATVDFTSQLAGRLRARRFMPFPFDRRLGRAPLRRARPVWTDCESDPNYHVRQSAVPGPGSDNELHALVARLHAQPLDFSRPLWECHVIEGLQASRFALYLKVHHCAADGLGLMSIIKYLLSDSAEDRALGTENDRRASRGVRSDFVSAESMPRRLHREIRTWKDLAACVREIADDDDNMLRVAMQTPRTRFNVRIGAHRRIATLILETSRLKAVGARDSATINDVIVALVATALRRYLDHHGALPDSSLTASIPVALPREAVTGSNAVGGFTTTLATDEPTHRARLRKIAQGTARAKAQLQKAPAAALVKIGALGLMPMMIGQRSGFLDKVRPFFNLAISNMVLSKAPLYLGGAELEAVHPFSVLFDGNALNVTVIGYRDSVFFGFTACRDVVPDLAIVADLTGTSLALLEGES